MADGMNRAFLMGNLGADPELRFTQSGTAVMDIRLATTTSYYDKREDEWKDNVQWHNVVVWGKRGESLGKILTKGSKVFVEGELRTSSYENRDGEKRYKTEVVATQVMLTGGNGGERKESSEGGRGDRRRRPSRIDDEGLDDVPF